MRTLIGVIAFFVWGGICIQWYVGGVKGLCTDDREEVQNTISSKVEPETDTLVEEVKPKPVTFTVSEMTINFPYARSEARLSKNEIDNLKLITGELQNAEAFLFLHGNTDSVGTEENNLKLGLERAEWVKDLVISYGLAKEKIVVESNGESKPVAENKTKAGRAENRRVDILVKTK
jgi:OmpA-OmpF porin, OOP family